MTTDTKRSAGALLERLREAEHARQAARVAPSETGGPATAGLGRRVGVAVIVTALTLLLRLPDSWTPGGWIQLALAALAAGWAAWPVHRSAVRAARSGRLTRDVPVSLGIAVALLWGVGALLGDGPDLHFTAVAAITALLLAGRLNEARADEATRKGLLPLLAPQPDDVAVLRIDPRTRITGEIRIATHDLVVGDQFVVRTGEVVVADGGVVDGSATLDSSRLTGDGHPTRVSVGDPVAGGTTSTQGRVVIEARTVGEKTLLARIQKLAQTVDSGTTLSTPIDRFVDRTASLFGPAVLAISVGALMWWFVTGSDRALAVAVSVLVGTSPAALSLAIPSALRVATGRSAHLGILVKGTEPLEQSRRVDAIVLEQTGTVTTGALQLRSIEVVGRLSKAAALKAAAAVAQGSSEPVDQAIVTGARLARIELPRITDFTMSPGEGASARIKGTEVSLGRAELFDRVDDVLLDHAHARGGQTLFVGWDGTAHAALTVEDGVRDSSRAAVERLRGLGLTAYLVSADGERSARRVAEQVGIERAHVHAGIGPERERAVVAGLQREGHRVAFVGLGRAPAALEQADLGIAMASGTDAATESGDVVVLRPGLEAVADAVELSRQARAVVRQNITGALVYNAAALVLALTGVLHPIVAAASGATASLIVLGNALRLRGYRR